MPVVTVYRHGGKGGVPPARNDHTRMKRGQVEGWSTGATRRNTQFLMSVREPDLTGAGVALTLTVRNCPASAEDWTRLRKRWVERQRRAGMVRLHWITEWQRRGVPHLHVAIWWPDMYRLSDPVEDWVELAGELYGAGRKGQHAAVIDGPVGWFKYLSKHAARGVKHYQRNNAQIPESWLEKTGRVWGHCGNWPLDLPRKFGLGLDDNGTTDQGWYWMRRMVRSWRIADARAAGDRRRIVYARGSFRSKEPELSKLRGYQDWMPAEQVQIRMLAGLAERGCSIVDLDTGEVLCGRGVERSSFDGPR